MQTNDESRVKESLVTEDVGRPVILVTEDNEAIRALLSAFLGSKGFGVIEAENGKQAVEAAESSRPDLIVMDLNMPVLDGVEAAKTIRQRLELRETPILVMTAYGELGIDFYLHLDSLGGGPIEYLTKPFEITDFENLVTDLLH
jgi:CheY-like chemotaxis protein